MSACQRCVRRTHPAAELLALHAFDIADLFQERRQLRQPLAHHQGHGVRRVLHDRRRDERFHPAAAVRTGDADRLLAA